MSIVRLATPTDAEACAEIARAAYAPYVPLIGREPPPMLQDFPGDIAAGDVWVAGDQVTGYVVARSKGAIWLLENVAVAPDHHGGGIGRLLIDHIEGLARTAGAEAIELYTHAKMTANRALYPRLDYIEIARRTEHGLDRVYFRKAL